MKILEKVLNFFYPQFCLTCGKTLRTEEALYCEACIDKLPLLKSYCQRCGNPLSEDLLNYLPEEKLTYCKACHDKELPFERVYVAFRYEEPIRSLIHQAKFRENFVLAYQLGRLLRNVLKLPLNSYDIILPIPLSLKRLRERGYNQSLLILWGYGGLKRIPSILKRIRHTLPQSNLSAKERERNVKGAFEMKGSIKGKKVLLLDDVMTSGATMKEAAMVLHKAGAKEVHLLVLARA